MKKLFFPLLLVSEIALGQNLQTTPLSKDREPCQARPLSEFVFPDAGQKNLFQKTEKSGQNDPGLFSTSGLMADPQAKFSYHTLAGSVYILSQDRMACVVANMVTVEEMPVGKLKNFPKGDAMPNGFPKQKILMIPIK